MCLKQKQVPRIDLYKDYKSLIFFFCLFLLWQGSFRGESTSTGLWRKTGGWFCFWSRKRWIWKENPPCSKCTISRCYIITSYCWNDLRQSTWNICIVKIKKGSYILKIYSGLVYLEQALKVFHEDLKNVSSIYSVKITFCWWWQIF